MSLFPDAERAPLEGEFARRIDQVIHTIDNRGVPLALPLDIRGTAFQQQVWQALRNIPCGKTASYQQVAQVIGKLARYVRWPQRVPQINWRSSSLVIVSYAEDGALSGYRWGTERKALLLKRESGNQEG